MERFANNPVTTLAEDLDGSELGVDVTSAASFPTGGNFRILVDSEIMLVTGVSSNTFTVTRGAEGTSATTHANGAAVTQILTKGAVDSLWEDAVSVRCPNFQVPVSGDFSWVNQGGASVTVRDNGGIFLSAPASTTASMRSRVKAAPSTPYTITALVIPSIYPIDYTAYGLIFREAATSKMEIMYFVGGNGGTTILSVDRWTNDTANAGNRTFIQTYALAAPIRWLQLHADGTNIVYRVSTDGENFFTVVSAAKNNHFTTAPDQVGFAANAENATVDCGGLLLSWKES